MKLTRNALLGAMAGIRAAAMRGAAEALFRSGGEQLLSEAARASLRSAVVGSSVKMVEAFAPALSVGTRAAGKLFADEAAHRAGAAVSTLGQGTARQAAMAVGANAATRAVARQAARAAGREILKGTGKAAGIGFLVDGAFGAYEGVSAYRQGRVTRNEALRHVAREASTGAVATSAGVLLAAGLVALTGAATGPMVFAVAAGGTIGAKELLRRVVR